MSVEEEIVEFQKMEKQLQEVSMRRLQIETQLKEVSNALEELEKTSEEEIYKLVGGILVKTTKADAIEDLKKKREMWERALHKYGEEEKTLRDKLTRLGKKLSQILQQQGGDQIS